MTAREFIGKGILAWLITVACIFGGYFATGLVFALFDIVGLQ